VVEGALQRWLAVEDREDLLECGLTSSQISEGVPGMITNLGIFVWDVGDELKGV
jgi:hypothetical protein